MLQAKRYLLSAALCFALCFSAGELAAKNATDTAINRAALAASLDAVLDSALEQNRIVGAVLLVSYDGQVIYERAAGYADREAQTRMRENAIFRLASVSKTFTSMATAALIQQDKLSLDDPVTKWLPEFTPALPGGGKATITIRQLLSHTAGLDYGFLQKKDGPYSLAGVSDGLDTSDISLEENLRRIASVPLLFEPGTAWHYSLATDVLGAVIAKVSGTDLPQAMRNLVTEPLGMKDTGFVVTDKSRLATPYINASPEPLRMRATESLSMGEGSVHFFPDRALNSKYYPSGGAGMAGTASEVLRLLETIRNGGAPLVGAALMATMNSNQIGKNQVHPGVGFGLGWAIILDPAADNTPQSPGTLQWGGVYGHSWFVDPAKKLTVVLLSNTTPEGMTGKLATDIRDAVYKNLPR